MSTGRGKVGLASVHSEEKGAALEVLLGIFAFMVSLISQMAISYLSLGSSSLVTSAVLSLVVAAIATYMEKAG